MAKSTSISQFKEARKSIRSAQHRRPIYYLYGDETFFMDRLQQQISSLVPDEQKDFNFDLLYGGETTPEKVLSIVRSFPMMAEQRVVIIRDFLKLRNTDTAAGNLNDFEHYAKNPNPSTLLCLIDKKLPDGRTSLGQSFKSKNNKNVHEFKFESLPDYQLAEWSIEWAKAQHNKILEPQASQILAQLVGNNLQLLSTEIDKVCTFIDTQERVTTNHIKKIIGSYREYSVIELKEAIFQRNLEKALSIAEQMLLKSNIDAGEVIRSVGFFYRVFADVWQIRRLMDKQLSKNQIQSELGVGNSYLFNFKWKDASQFQLAEMPRIFEALLDADRAAKGFSTLDVPSIYLLLIKRIIG